jgi:hypothetical protein
MNEKELGRMLLAGNGPTDVAALTARVLARDRRRIWLLGVGCVVAWMAVVMLPWATVMPMLAKVAEHQNEPNAPGAATAPAHPMSADVLQAVRIGTIMTFIGSVASMFVAAVFTVAMIVVSRRATLRQVNVRLAEISAHLQTLSRKEQ